MSSSSSSRYVSLLRRELTRALPPMVQLEERALHARIHDYYIPVYNYLKQQVTKNIDQKSIDSSSESKKRPPVFVGISAAQGCGKTTLTKYMELLFEQDDLNCIVMSLDDFYLTHAEQTQLAIEQSNNPMLQYRGNAGTHDLSLMMNTLTALAQNDSQQTPVSIPRYNKSLHAGRGDREPQENWSPVNKHVDIVLFEGWMLGFTPVSDPTVLTLENSDPSPLPPSHGELFPFATDMTGITEVNHMLKGYQRLHYLFDAWLVLGVQNASVIYDWRAQAEHAARAFGLPGLSDEELKDFVGRYMPAYRAYLPSLYSCEEGDEQTQTGPEKRDESIPVLTMRLNEHRLPI